jgi:hypothetical protein
MSQYKRRIKGAVSHLFLDLSDPPNRITNSLNRILEEASASVTAVSSRESDPVGQVQCEVGPRSLERGHERQVDVAC